LVALWQHADEPLLRDLRLEGATVSLVSGLRTPSMLEVVVPDPPDPVTAYRLLWVAPGGEGNEPGLDTIPPEWRGWRALVRQDLPGVFRGPHARWRLGQVPSGGPGGVARTGVPVYGLEFVRFLRDELAPRLGEAQADFEDLVLSGPGEPSEAEVLDRLLQHCLGGYRLPASEREAWVRALVGKDFYRQELAGGRRTPDTFFRPGARWPRLARVSGRWVLHDLAGRARTDGYFYSLLLPLGSVVQPAGHFVLDEGLGELDSECELV
jgi:hypothetical protein